MKLFGRNERDVGSRTRRFSLRMSSLFRSQENSIADNNVNALDANGMTQLHVATVNGCLTTMKKLLQEGAEVDGGTSSSSSSSSSRVTGAGHTPLRLAVREGNVDAAKLLLENGARIDSGSYRGHTLLHLAAEAGNVPIAEALLKRGASPSSECTSDEAGCTTPLGLALKRSHLGMVKLLLAFGARTVKAGGHTRYTCNERTLQLALSTNNYTIVAYVLMSIVELDKKSCSKTSRLDAVNSSEMEYTDIACHASKWILSTCCRCCCGTSSALLLAAALMHSAVELGYSKIVKNFLKWGVDVDSLYHPLREATLGHSTLLHTATRHRHLDVVKLLISHGADVNARDDDRRTPIFVAILNLDVNMTNLLLSSGANVGIERDSI